LNNFRGISPVKLKLLKRRVEMLDAVSTGLHPSAVISQLAEKYSVSERCLWSDWLRRDQWVPVLLGLQKYAGFCETVEEKLSAVQKAAWSVYMDASNDNARVGALKAVLESLELTGNIVQVKDILGRLAKLEEAANNKTQAKGRA
jgi:hypothetical protein